MMLEAIASNFVANRYAIVVVYNISNNWYISPLPAKLTHNANKLLVTDLLLEYYDVKNINIFSMKYSISSTLETRI